MSASNDPEGELARLLPRLMQSSRVHFIDNLRSALVALVILHHACIPFGGSGGWPYISPYPVSHSAAAILTLFNALNQTFFMGMLFFLAAHFSAIAAERKTWRGFVVDKLKRLGIPVFVYMLVGHPLVVVLVQWARRAAVWPALRAYYLHLDSVRGALWFVAVLLVFDLVYVTATRFLSFGFLIPRSAAQYRAAVVLGISAVILSSFFIRLSYPVGRTIPVLSLQFAYTPQYVFAYMAGTSLSKTQQYFLVENPARRLVVVLALAILSISLFFGGGVLFRLPLDGMPWSGGMNAFALFYAIWNEVCFYFIGTALFSLFRECERTSCRWGGTARYSYAAFLVHTLVVVLLQILVDAGMGELWGVVKAVLVGVPAVVGS